MTAVGSSDPLKFTWSGGWPFPRNPSCNYWWTKGKAEVTEGGWILHNFLPEKLACMVHRNLMLALAKQSLAFGLWTGYRWGPVVQLGFWEEYWGQALHWGGDSRLYLWIKALRGWWGTPAIQSHPGYKATQPLLYWSFWLNLETFILRR